MPGLAYPWSRAPIFKTRKQMSVSGKEVRIADWNIPRYQWTLTYTALRQGTLLGSWAEFRQLESFFEQLKGGFDSFLYTDPDDNIVTGQQIGTGDGTTVNFALQRTFGTASIPILAPNLGLSHQAYVNASPVTPSAITPWGTSDPLGPGIVELSSPPAGGQAVTIDYSYYFPVRFDDDTMTFEKFMINLYKLQKMSFTSIK